MDAWTKKRLQSTMYNAQNNINNLKNQRAQYQNLKNKINNDLLPNLRNAKSSLNQARAGLKSSYTSTESTKKSNSIQGYADRVTSIINTLSQSVIPSIDSKLNSINQGITSNQTNYNNAQYRLYRGY